MIYLRTSSKFQEYLAKPKKVPLRESKIRKGLVARKYNPVQWWYKQGREHAKFLLEEVRVDQVSKDMRRALNHGKDDRERAQMFVACICHEGGRLAHEKLVDSAQEIMDACPHPNLRREWERAYNHRLHRIRQLNKLVEDVKYLFPGCDEMGDFRIRKALWRCDLDLAAAVEFLLETDRVYAPHAPYP